MTTYNTQNPLGSSDPRDLYDNAENLDNFVNGDQAAYNDRLGKSRRSWQSVEDQVNQQAAEFQAAQDNREGVFNSYLVSAGYQFAGDYAAGIEITQYNQVVRDTSGEFWRVSGSTALPYTTTGDGLPEGGAFVAVGDAALRQELALSVSGGNGAALVNGATIYVGSVAELEAMESALDGQEAMVQGVPFRFESGAWKPSQGYVSSLCFTGSDGGSRIQAALDYAETLGKNTVVLVPSNGPDADNRWLLNDRVMLPSNTFLMLDGCHLYLNDNTNTNIFRTKG